MKTLAEKYITLMPGDCMDVLTMLPDNSLDIEWDSMWSKPFHKPEYIAGNGSLSRRLETLHNLQLIEKAIESDNKST